MRMNEENKAYVLILHHQSTNGLPDCQNKMTKLFLNGYQLQFVRLEADGSLRSCSNEKETSCYGRATRITPTMEN